MTERAYEASCVFCRIVAGEDAAHRVLEAERFVGFLDTRPLFPGHVLLVPRGHVPTLAELPEDLAAELFTTARRVAAVQQEVLGCQGNFLALNNIVSQSVPHVHQHVVPRTKGDGLRGFFWPRKRYRSGEAEDVAARLGAALGG